ncbi:hypothetical protein [Leuconostoc mesenteroides]|uniref:hypothetical protein n=1 Tax=Leuconostoc mesenteroides TaxID=1245 RepID=UPI002362B3FA|nr:hypothetical protein [Leuconostoc mesenteroides]
MHGVLGELFDEIGWFGALILGLTGTSIFGWIKVWSVQFKLFKKASLATLHSQLYDKGGLYIVRGSITLSELDDLEYTWQAYKDLGGNGTGEKIYQKCRELPISDYVPNKAFKEVEDVAAEHEAKRNA